MLAEYFLLYRNGKLYATRESRAPLIEITEGNPDFTEPQNGKMPEWQIVKYVPAILGASAAHYLSS